MNSDLRRLALAGLMSLMTASFAHAQYGMYGWNGWGSTTVGGDRARGMGAYAAGAGIYNEQTAEARAINTQTNMNLNEYLYESEQIHEQQYYQKMAGREARTREAGREIQDRHLNNPTPADITSGDAVNALYRWLSNPKIPYDLMHSAGADLTLSGDEVRKIPLNSAAQGVVVSIARLAGEDQWPGVLRGEPFDTLRKQYAALVEELRERPDGEPVPDEAFDQAITLLERMRSAARSQLKGPDFAAAERYLKAHVGLLQMTRKLDFRDQLERARDVKEVPLTNALTFLQVHNLQFGKAEGPEEQALYLNSLYPKLAEMRNRILSMAGGPPPVPQTDPSQGAPTAMFGNMPWEQMTGKGQPASR